jgi:hypothetical protein
MDPENAQPLESRPPTLDDLLALCRQLNAAGAKYMVIGGMAVIQHGFVRATEDIDLLIDSSPENIQRIQQALSYLPDGAIRDVRPSDVEQYMVVRVADEICVDLMKAACAIEYTEAVQDVIRVTIRGVEIPFANLDLLWRMKQTYREKDALDRQFLAEKLRQRTP